MKKVLLIWTFFILILAMLIGVLLYIYLNRKKFKGLNNSEISTTTDTSESADTFQEYTYEVIHEYPHDQDAFTQGLVFADGFLYEGTGLEGQSTLRKVDLATGEILQIYKLQNQYFGEGVAIFDDKIVQLTWQSNKGFVYDMESFNLLREFNYPTEGWGITYDGEHLIMSDGSSKLYFLDTETFEEVSSLSVYDSSGPVEEINELEYIKGEIYANVWLTDYILRINPQTGKVTAKADMTGLLNPEDQSEKTNVLNGIAYDAASDRLFVTGKLWPILFEIKLVPVE